MSKRSERNRAKREEEDRERKEKYYDSNTLTIADCQKEIYNLSGTGFVGLTSHLAVGEAISNEILLDDDLGEGEIAYKAEQFIRFLLEQKENGCLRFVGADGDKSAIRYLLDNTELSLSDAHHFAIAIKAKCVSLISTDPDLYGLPRGKIEAIKKLFGLDEFIIEKREF